MRVRVAAATAALITTAAIGAAGCGNGEKKTGIGAQAKVTFQTTGRLAISTDLSKKPKIPTLTGLPPQTLATQDVVVGSGKAAKAGDRIQVQYVGVSHSTDQEFDSSWGGKPFVTPLVKGNVIDGWVRGIAGMKQGGRRVLIIPPELGYAATGHPPKIAPYETLVFVVDLKKIG